MSSSATETLVEVDDAQDGHLASPRARSSSGASSPATGSRPTRRSPTSRPTRWTSRSRRRRAAGWRGSSSRPATRSTSARRSPRSMPGRAPGEAHPQEDRDARRRAGPAARRTSRTVPGSSRPSCGGSPTSTTSISSQVEGTGIGGRVRKKDVLAYVEAGGNGKRRRPGRCTPSRRTGRTGARREPRTSDEPAEGDASRADDPHAPGDREAHGRQPPDRGALHDDRRGRHVAGRRAAGAAEAGDGPARRARSPTSRSSRARRSRRSSTTRC